MPSLQRNYSGGRLRESIARSAFSLAAAMQRTMAMMALGFFMPGAATQSTLPAGKRSRNRAAPKGPGDRRKRPARNKK